MRSQSKDEARWDSQCQECQEVSREREREQGGHGMNDRDGKCGMLLTVHVLHVQ